MDGFDELYSWLASAGGALSGNAAVRAAMWVLAGVFVVSGLEKLRRPVLASLAMADFRVVRRPSARTGLALSGTELALAGALIAGAILGEAPLTASALAAGLVLSTFVVLIARSLRREDRFDCFCFGPGGAPLSWRSLVRTLALTAVALTGVLAGEVPPSAAPHVEASLGIGVLCSVAMAGAIRHLLRWNRDPFGLEVEAVKR